MGLFGGMLGSAAGATITATFVGKDGITPVIKGIRSEMTKVGTKTGGPLGGLLGGIASLSPASLIAGAGIGTLTGALVGSVAAFEEQQKISAQTEAVLKSTGGTANVTADQVKSLADQIANMSGVDDKTIQSGENLLLTFTNIQNRVGQGNDIFDQATQSITDMSVALGEDMSSAAIQLGKALNDPIKGLTALQRVGVQFTNQQKTQIATMVQAGDVASAQKVILGELQKEFGGSAAAFGETAAGSVGKFNVALQSLEETIGAKLTPALVVAANVVTTLLGSEADSNKIQQNYARFNAQIGESAATGSKEIDRMSKSVEYATPVLNSFADEGRHVGNEFAFGLKTAVQAAATFPTSIKNEIESGKGQVRAAMADIAWAMKHPFADDQYVRWLKGQIKKAEHDKLVAQRDGDTAVVAEITQTIAAEKALINSIHSKTVSVNVDFYNQTRHPLLNGGRAGGGPVYRGSTYIVGEHGPEVLHMGSGGGGYVTQGRSGGGGGVPPHSHPIIIDGKELGRAVAPGVNASLGRSWYISGQSPTRN